MNCSHAEEQKASRHFFFCCCRAFFFRLPESSHQRALTYRREERREEGKDVLKWNRNLAGGEKKVQTSWKVQSHAVPLIQSVGKKKKKKNLPADPWKITLFRTKMSQAAPSRGFHLILFWGLFLGLLQDEISDFLEKLARVMPRSRNDSGRFFFFFFFPSPCLKRGDVWKDFRGRQTSKHHVEGQFQGGVASTAASTPPWFAGKQGTWKPAGEAE